MTTTAKFPVPGRPVGWTALNESRWAQVFHHILVIEGGWVDDKADRGGATKFGISLRFAKAIGEIDTNRDGFGDLDLNFDTVIDGCDIKLLTREIAEALYLEHFWIKPGFWSLPRPIDAAVFDQAVNGGTTAAIKLLQRALNRTARVTGTVLTVDGQLGPKTRAAVAARPGERLLTEYRLVAAERYEAIVRADPSQTKYRKGWLRRARELGRV
ncbi:MAG: glycoside hydrolase family 108 protein [Caulobacter sp.]